MSGDDLLADIDLFGYSGQRVGHDSSLYSTVSCSDDFDNVVADINMISAGLDQTVNTSYGETEEGKQSDVPLSELSDEGDFEIAIPPGENYRIMKNVAEEATLYIPDHVMESLPKALDNEFGGTGYYNQAKEIHEGIFEFLNLYAEPLEVKEKMGLDYYTNAALRSKHSGKTEDDFIIEAAAELDGDTVIMTYDSDFLSNGITAAAPKAVEHILGN